MIEPFDDEASSLLSDIPSIENENYGCTLYYGGNLVAILVFMTVISISIGMWRQSITSILATFVTLYILLCIAIIVEGELLNLFIDNDGNDSINTNSSSNDSDDNDESLLIDELEAGEEASLPVIPNNIP